MKRHLWMVPAALALAAAGSGCKHDDQYTRRTRVPGVDGVPTDGAPQSGVKAWYLFPEDKGVSGAGAADLAEFCAKVAAAGTAAGHNGSVGCLPLVMYDSDHSGPWVPELGVALADEVADGLRARGFT